MEHPERQLLIDLADGQLPDSVADEVREHLNICQLCQVTALEEANISHALHAQSFIEPSPAFDRNVLDAMLPASAVRSGKDVSFRKYAGLLVLCVVTLVVVILAMGQPSEPQGWMAPVLQTMSSFSTSVTQGFTQGIHQVFSPVRTLSGSDSFLNIFALAVLALVVLGGLDRIISPLLRKGR